MFRKRIVTRPVNKTEKKNEAGSGRMEVAFILDRSGSMTGREDDTIGGFNATLKSQRAENENILWTTVLFDDRYEVIHDRRPIGKVKELTRKDYYVRGCTALLDAVGRTISHIAGIHKYARPEDVPEKTLIVITTDGMENASREYTYEKVREMIEHEKEKYGWEFLFLGANIDAVGVAGRMGIAASRAATFINDDIGIQKNFEAVGSAMRSYACAPSIRDDVFDEVRADFKKRSRR